jgi:hypothetical protein
VKRKSRRYSNGIEYIILDWENDHYVSGTGARPGGRGGVWNNVRYTVFDQIPTDEGLLEYRVRCRAREEGWDDSSETVTAIYTPINEGR